MYTTRVPALKRNAADKSRLDRIRVLSHRSSITFLLPAGGLHSSLSAPHDDFSAAYSLLKTLHKACSFAAAAEGVQAAPPSRAHTRALAAGGRARLL